MANYYYDLPADIINLINVKVNDIYKEDHKINMNSSFAFIKEAKRWMSNMYEVDEENTIYGDDESMYELHIYIRSFLLRKAKLQGGKIFVPGYSV